MIKFKKEEANKKSKNKSQEPRTKQIQMSNIQTSKRFDLEDRTRMFAKNIREFVEMMPKTPSNMEDIPQLIRSSGSIGANYIEANEALGKKDFMMRIKIARKEAKESRYWLTLIDTRSNETLNKSRQQLIGESTQLTMIFTSILKKVV